MDAEPKALSARLTAGDPAAMQELVEAFGPRLSRLAAGLLGDPARAADAVQETFLKLWRTRGSLGEVGNLGSWLSTICLNECRTVRRGQLRERRALRGAAVGLPEEAPGHADQGTEWRLAFAEALAALPDREREAFLLIAVEGLGSEEAGKAMGCSGSSARTYLGRARKDLAGRLGMWLE